MRQRDKAMERDREGMDYGEIERRKKGGREERRQATTNTHHGKW